MSSHIDLGETYILQVKLTDERNYVSTNNRARQQHRVVKKSKYTHAVRLLICAVKCYNVSYACFCRVVQRSIFRNQTQLANLLNGQMSNFRKKAGTQ